MSLQMTRAEREAFLAGTHVAVLGVARADRGPLALPIWYRYEPGGDVRMVTSGRSLKANLLRDAGRASLCAQNEELPYRYVSVEGPVSLSAEVDYERDIRDVAIRYLGESLGKSYLEETHPNGVLGDSLLVSLRPQRWSTVDYAKA